MGNTGGCRLFDKLDEMTRNIEVLLSRDARKTSPERGDSLQYNKADCTKSRHKFDSRSLCEGVHQPGGPPGGHPSNHNH